MISDWQWLAPRLGVLLIGMLAACGLVRVIVMAFEWVWGFVKFARIMRGNK